jgi:hypothetical protein
VPWSPGTHRNVRKETYQAKKKALKVSNLANCALASAGLKDGGKKGGSMVKKAFANIKNDPAKKARLNTIKLG